MNKLVKMTFNVKTQYSESGVTHTLNTTVHKEVLSNAKRLQSHCSAIGRKTYGNRCKLVSVIAIGTDEVLYERKR